MHGLPTLSEIALATVLSSPPEGNPSGDHKIHVCNDLADFFKEWSNSARVKLGDLRWSKEETRPTQTLRRRRPSRPGQPKTQRSAKGGPISQSDGDNDHPRLCFGPDSAGQF